MGSSALQKRIPGFWCVFPVVLLLWWLSLQAASSLGFPSESQFKVEAPDQCAQI